ncbi:MAG: nucleotidyltransferase domain-containing protein [Promethearchaeia archaeon]
MEKVKFSKIKRRLKSHPKLERLEKFLKKFFKDYSAEFIVLFGSSAKANFNYRSDLDLLIVSDSVEGDFFSRQLKLQQINPGGIDLFLYNAQEFKKMVNNLHLIVLEALSNGIILCDQGKGKKYRCYINDLKRREKIKQLDHGWEVSDSLR